MAPESPEDVLYLYHDDLFLLPEPLQPAQTGEGAYQKRILLLCPAAGLSPEHRVLIQKMMTACGLQEADYLMQAVPDGYSATELIRVRKPECAILFGLDLRNEALHLMRDLNTVFRFAGIRFLLTHSLAELSASTEKKTALWQKGLKPLFNV